MDKEVLNSIISKLTPRLIGILFSISALSLAAVLAIAILRGVPIDLKGFKIGHQDLPIDNSEMSKLRQDVKDAKADKEKGTVNFIV